MNNQTEFIPPDSYRLIIEHIPIVAIDVLFFNQEKTETLLFKRTNEPAKNIYYAIGGRLYKNENIVDCGLRQIKREAGLIADKNQLFFGGAQNEIWDNSMFGNISQHFVTIFFGYVLNNEEIRLDSQHSDWKWFSTTDDDLHPLIRSKLEALLEKK